MQVNKKSALLPRKRESGAPLVGTILGNCEARMIIFGSPVKERCKSKEQFVAMDARFALYIFTFGEKFCTLNSFL
jgi:hypothetical protein